MDEKVDFIIWTLIILWAIISPLLYRCMTCGLAKPPEPPKPEPFPEMHKYD